MHYKKAFVNYKKALQVLGERHNSPGIWDVVKWELSTALFTMATILVEHPDPALVRIINFTNSIFSKKCV